MSFKEKLLAGQSQFLGGKFTNYSKTISPNISIKVPTNLSIDYLKFNKVLPRVDKHYSGATSCYLYIYLNPYKPAETIDDFHYKIPAGIFKSNDLYFGYEPFYIGKGVSSTGHRMNQHIADFLQLDEDTVGQMKVKNVIKMNKMKEVSELFNSVQEDPYSILPKNWSEYKKEWVIIAFNFPDRLSLEVAEKILIQTIGSVDGIKRGPLTNISLTKTL